MIRRTAAAVVLATPLLASAGPGLIPVGNDQLARWGAVVTPCDGDTVTSQGGRLVIRSAGGVKGILLFPGQRNLLPRAVRDVAGDFDVSVRLVRHTPPAATPPNQTAETFAGLCVFGGGQSLFLARRHALQPLPNRRSLASCGLVQYVVGERQGGGGPTEGPQTDEPFHVRLTRKDGVLSAFSSPDGKKWDVVTLPACPLPDNVVLGVFLGQTVDLKSEAVFEDYRLTVKPAAGK